MGKLTWGLITANVIVFLLVFSMPKEMMDAAFNLLSFSGPHIIELWRLITSLFMHADASHLFFNMLGLYFFGSILEKEFKTKKIFLLTYFLAGFAGNMAFAFFSGGAVVGASGCVFGLMGAAMLLKPKENIKLYLFPLPLGIIAILYALVETMLVYYGQYADGVAHVSHVAGLLVGAYFAFRHSPKEAGKGIFWLALFVGLIIVLGPIFYFIMDIGDIILGVVDLAVGAILYTISWLLSLVLW